MSVSYKVMNTMSVSYKVMNTMSVTYKVMNTMSVTYKVMNTMSVTYKVMNTMSVTYKVSPWNGNTLTDKENVLNTVASKDHADNFLGHKRIHYYWFPWKRSNCIQSFLLQLCEQNLLNIVLLLQIRVDLGIIGTKGYSKLSKSLELVPHH